MACGFLISYLIGHRTIKVSKSNQSVHGFWIRLSLRRPLFRGFMIWPVKR